jgi:cyclophilin family peptidyl-prolyl cis-trans isomerase
MRFLFILGLLVGMVALAACGGGGEKTGDEGRDQAAAPSDQGAEPGRSESGPAESPTEKENPILERSMAKDPGPKDEYAVIKTNMGTISIRFYPDQAPLAVSNFKGLAAKGYYDGIVLHRVIDGFMVQGGDPTGTGFRGESVWGGKFKDEFTPSLRFNRPGLLAMANSGPNTNGSQFFITQVPTPHLDDKHTIFGEVMEGMDVVNAIAAVRVDQRNKPVKPVVMESVTIESGQR